MLSKLCKVRSHDSRPSVNLAFHSGESVTAQKTAAAFNQYFASSMAQATVSEPSQPQTRDNPALSVESFEINVIAQHT